ncbi:MAG: hypothetical protein U0232_04710 [Thermomicrobiales bacterium]
MRGPVLPPDVLAEALERAREMRTRWIDELVVSDALRPLPHGRRCGAIGLDPAGPCRGVRRRPGLAGGGIALRCGNVFARGA